VTVRKLSYDASTQGSTIIKDFLVDQNIYASASVIPAGKIVGVSKDISSTIASYVKWPDASANYWEYTSPDFAPFQKDAEVAGTEVPSGSVLLSGGVTTRSGYLPDSVQVFYVEVAGENRAIIVNGADPDELTTNLVAEIRNILAEKELDGYYSVEVVDSGSETGTSISMGWVAETYIDFGRWGMLLAGVGIGAFYGLIYRFMTTWRRIKGLIGFGVATSILLPAALLESSITKVIGGLVVATLAAFLIVRVVVPLVSPWISAGWRRTTRA
jgi:hypothetical protein